MLKSIKVKRNLFRLYSTYQHVQVSDPGEMDYSLTFLNNSKQISPWHDIEFRNKDGTYNFVVEIPKK